ncbi:peroxisomal leader peptide-processing protease-like [Homarus americanus]|uniref:peroxisomal leader peptide-processing protease-like n=1 Tax=Homarus americanus TaxID=6706 RepID=UPI001C44DD14|nr:peroxisomal leader peptide-processing protease-like [Homarus americanus]
MIEQSFTVELVKKMNKMEGFGVIVEYSRSEKNSSENISCSGIYMGKGIILTHGTIVTDILKDKRAELLLQELSSKGHVCTEDGKNLLRTVLEVTHSHFRVILPAEELGNELTHTKHVSAASSSSVQEKKGSHKLLITECPENKLQIENPSSLLPTEEIQNIIANSAHVSQPSTSLKMATPNYSSLPASVEMMFVQPGISKSVTRIMPASQGWKLTEDEEKDRDVALEILILSTFVLIKILPDFPRIISDDTVMEATNKDVINLTEQILSLTSITNKGVTVYVESSPFGTLSPSVFLNSLSCGIISNVDNTASDIMLTDARCIMGSEGAPVFEVMGGRRHLCGMVISPFCWRGGEWLGLTLLASMKPVLQALLHFLNSSINCENGETKLSHNQDNSPNDKNLRNQVEETLQRDERLQENIAYNQERKWTYDDFVSKKGNPKADLVNYLNGSVVAVCCGGGWGTGFVISTSPGIILTCAHVTDPTTSGNVRIMLSDGRKLPGRVIHQTRPYMLNHQSKSSTQGSSVWDLAVVITDSSLPMRLPLASTLPPKGSPVVLAGYGMFSPNRLPTPTLSQGIVSKVVNFPIHSLHWPTHPSSEKDDQMPVKNMDDYNTGMVVNRICDDIVKQGSKDGLTGFEDFKKDSQDVIKSDALESCDNEHPDVERIMDGHVLVSSDNNGMIPMIMQTTCAVYAGTSGGPIVSIHPQRGLQVVGVVVCNTCDLGNKATFPHINLAIPAAAIFKIIEAFLQSGDKTVLRYLDAECSTATQLWSLGLLPESRL